MNQQLQYRVARGSIRLPRKPGSVRKFDTANDYLIQGQVVPEGSLDEAEISRFLKSGVLEPLAAQEASLASKVPVSRGRWSVDPAGLAGKSFEELLIMVLEIDPDFEVGEIQNAGDAVRQLTADWNPAFRDQLAKASDKSRPERLRTDGARDKGQVAMSQIAENALARAKERAAGSSQEG